MLQAKNTREEMLEVETLLQHCYFLSRPSKFQNMWSIKILGTFRGPGAIRSEDSIFYGEA